MKTKSFFGVLGAVVLLLAAGSAQATVISITNPEFDHPGDAAQPQAYSYGWTYSYHQGGQSTTYNAPGSTGGAAECGTAGIWQGLEATIEAGVDYTLTGSFYNVNARAAYLYLYAVPTVPTWSKEGLTPSGMTSLGSIPVAYGATGTWADTTLFVPASSVPAAAVGQHLLISLYSTGAWVPADHFSLNDSTVPEPSAVVLLVSGLIGLLAYAWRKRR